MSHFNVKIFLNCFLVSVYFCIFSWFGYAIFVDALSAVSIGTLNFTSGYSYIIV